MKVRDMKRASDAQVKCAKLIDQLNSLFNQTDDKRANEALYEYLREAGYFFLGVAASVKDDE